MNAFSFTRLHLVAALSAFGGIFLAAVKPSLDPDLFWHLRSGELITRLGRLPHGDPFSFTAAGRPWLNHEWLADVITFGVHQIAGMWGVVIFFALITTTTFVFVALRSFMRGVSVVLTFFGLLASLLIASGTIGPRMQIFTLFFTALILLLLEYHAIHRQRRILFALPLLMLIWSNLHGGFMVGLVLQAIYLAGALLYESRRKAGHWKGIAIALLTSVGTTLLNPNGLDQFLYPFRFLRPNPFTQRIAESSPPDLSHPASIVFGVCVLLLVLSLIRGWHSLSFSDICVASLFTILALQQVRHLALWAVAVMPVLLVSVSQLLKPLTERYPQRELGSVSKAALDVILLLVVLVGYGMLTTHYLRPGRIIEIEARRFPQASVAAVERHGSKKIFALYEWGGYVLWKTRGPRVFFDGRADTVYGPDVLDQYLKIYSASPGWERDLIGSGADALVVESRSEIARSARGSGSWQIVHRDALSTAFVRR